MDRFAKLVAACLLALGASAHAGYAYPADPPGFTRNGGSGFTGNGYAVNSANDQAFGRVVHQPNGLRVSVPGRPVTMPASYRFAANAPRVAAGILFLNPAIRTGAAIAAWLLAGKLFWDDIEKVWKTNDDVEGNIISNGYEYIGNGGNKYPTKELACQSYIADPDIASSVNAIPGSRLGLVHVGGGEMSCRIIRPNGNYSSSGYSTLQVPGACPAGWYVTPAGCVQTPPPQTVTDPDEFARKILNPDNQPGWPNVPADWPMPERVPFELPPNTPLPVDPPYINPEPSPNPQHRPLFVPNGDPVPNPNYNPNAQPSPENQPWIQPGVRVNPSPTEKDPFRVDVKPIDRPKPTGDPSTGPESEPSPNPGQPNNPGDKPKPEDPPGLCDLYPDILACVKLDKPDEPDIPEKEKEISITPDSGWGLEGGTCPPPRTLMVQGREIPIPFDLFCTYMNGLRPIIIAMAWLSAAFILVGAREGN